MPQTKVNVNERNTILTKNHNKPDSRSAQLRFANLPEMSAWADYEILKPSPVLLQKT